MGTYTLNMRYAEPALNVLFCLFGSQGVLTGPPAATGSSESPCKIVVSSLKNFSYATIMQSVNVTDVVSFFFADQASGLRVLVLAFCIFVPLKLLDLPMSCVLQVGFLLIEILQIAPAIHHTPGITQSHFLLTFRFFSIWVIVLQHITCEMSVFTNGVFRLQGLLSRKAPR